MVIQHLMRILDFEDEDLAIQEANKKLANTIMWVNGKLESIRKLNYDNVIVITTEGDKLITEVNELEVFMPEPGLYLSKDGTFSLVLKKKSSKQWRKSFNHDLYTWYCKKDIWDFNDIDWTYHKILCFEGKMFYKQALIGTYKDKNILCTNQFFYQELLDYTTRNNQWNLLN